MKKKKMLQCCIDCSYQCKQYDDLTEFCGCGVADIEFFGETEDEHMQIEEMTKDLKENLRLFAGVKLLDHQVETIAYELLKKYQPKNKEITNNNNQFWEDFNKGYAQGIKDLKNRKVLK